MPIQPVTEQIIDLLRGQPGLTLSGIASRLQRNPGGIRNRLVRMTQTGRVVAMVGPKGWTVYGLPPEPKEG